MDAEYSWQNLKGSGGYKTEPLMKRYGWWVSLAILLSILLHIGLFILFQRIELTETERVKVQTAQVTNRDQIAVDEETLRKILKQEEPVPDESEAIKDIDFTFEEDAPPELPDLPPVVLLTSSTQSIVGNFAMEAPVVAPQVDLAAVDLEVNVETDEADLNAMRDQLSEAANTSMLQPEIHLKEADLPSGETSDQVVEAISKNLGGGAGAKIRGRFKGLDSVLMQGGQVQSGDEFLIPTDLVFNFSEYRVKEDAKLSLMKLGGIILANPDAVFVFKGYTDSIPFKPKPNAPRGEPRSNLDLSLMRAQAVRDWIVNSLNLQDAEARMKTKGYGASNPLIQPTGDLTRDKSVEAANRRVEIEVISGT